VFFTDVKNTALKNLGSRNIFYQCEGYVYSKPNIKKPKYIKMRRP
jgi:hypothetical protein